MNGSNLNFVEFCVNVYAFAQSLAESIQPQKLLDSYALFILICSLIFYK